MSWRLDIENVAGIRDGQAKIDSGANAVRGSNWQGKTSFLAAIETAMGTKKILTEGKTHGRVKLDTSERTVELELERHNGRVVVDGNPYLDTEQMKVCADLFAFLGDDNDVRHAVRNGENLEALLTKPLDFENIDEQIADLERERDQVDAELDEADQAAEQLPQVDQRVTELQTELEELRSQRADLVSEDDATVTEQREALSDALAERQTVRNRIDRLERTVDRTKKKLEERRKEFDDTDIPDEADDVVERLADAQKRLTEAERDAELLQSVYAPTKRLLEEDRLDLITEVDRGVVEDSLICWNCGDKTTREEIEKEITALGNRVTDLRKMASAAQEEVDQLQEARQEYREARRRREDLEAEITNLEETLSERETSLKHAREHLNKVESRIDELSAQVEREDDKITDVDSNIKYTKASLEDVIEERDQLEKLANRKQSLRNQRENLTKQITDLRTRKRELKQRTRNAFDQAMNEVIDKFETGFESARLTPNFDIIVARDGREATLEALSEGEVELLGLVAALAGHSAFEIAEDVPVLLVDNLGGLSDEHLHTLIALLEDYAEFLIFTTYPEHGEFDGNTIDPTAWSVVSDQVEVRT